MDKDTLKLICARIDSYFDEAIKIQKGMTAIPALAPENEGEGEEKKAAYLKSYLENEIKCDEIKVINAPDGRVPAGVRPNIIAKIKGKSSKKTIWIMSHMDVVPPGDLQKWDSDPWTIRVENGKIYGRGTEDNQQGIVTSLLLAKAFTQENQQPEYDIGILLVADEETGNKYGIQYLLQHHPDLFSTADYILIPDSGNADGSDVEIAEKSIIWFKFEVLGKQTHGSTPELGVNAFRAGAHLIIALNDLYNKFNTSDRMFNPPISTFEPTKKAPNVPNVNTIPGQDIFYYDCRILPIYSIQTIKDGVKDICKKIEKEHRVKVNLSYELEVTAPPPTPENAPVVQSLLKAISEIKKVQPRAMGIGGGTVAAFFRQAGFNAVVWATQDETLHQPNEYAKIGNILSDVKVFAHITLQK